MKFSPMSFLFIFVFVLFLHIFLFQVNFFTRANTEALFVKKNSMKVIKLSFVQEPVIVHKQEESLEKKENSPPKKVLRSFSEKKIQKKKLFVAKQRVEENKKVIHKNENKTIIHKNNKLSKIKQSTPKSKKGQIKEVSLFEQNRALKEYMRYVSDTINKNKFYPKLAKKMGIEGECKIALKIISSGNIADFHLVQKSSYDAFNKTALEIIKRIGKFKPFPSRLQKKDLILEIPLRYNLKG
jgi:periplasmic protein TonB